MKYFGTVKSFDEATGRGSIAPQEPAAMDTVKDVAQIIYYLTLSIAGPLALIEYFRVKKRDRLANEYKIYDELNNRFFEY